MTREEAIAYGKRVIDLGLNDETQAFCEMAIKALEQEPVLDKIRAEIEQIEINGHIRDVECFNAGVDTALKIIDKYRVESEAENDD